MVKGYGKKAERGLNGVEVSLRYDNKVGYDVELNGARLNIKDMDNR